MDADSVDYFLARDLTEVPPALEGQPGRKIGNRGDDFYGIAGAARKMPHALMDENSLKGIDLVGIESCERQDSQGQTVGSRFFPEGFQIRSGVSFLYFQTAETRNLLVPYKRA